MLPRTSMTLETRTVRSIGWSATSRIAQLLMGILISAILARLLIPSDFGLIAMVAVFSNFAAIFSGLGLTSAIVQKKEISDEAMSSTFWINVGLGALLTLALAASAPLIAAFFSQPRLTPLVVFISTTFFIASLGDMHFALLTRRMDFKAIAIIGVCTVGIAGPIAIFLAFSGYGVWSLAWYAVLSTSFTVVFTWIYARWVPQFLLGLEHVKGLLGFGANLTGWSFVNYFGQNMDNLLVGRFLGSAALGFYNLAYNLLVLPTSTISTVVGNVMFPALSIIQHDKQLVRDAYVTANRYIAAVSFPLMIWVLVTAPQLVRVVYGPKWIPVILLIQIFALAGLEQSIGTNVQWIFLSQGRTDVMFELSVVTTVIVVISFVVGLRGGGRRGSNRVHSSAILDSLPYFCHRISIDRHESKGRVGTAVVSYIGSTHVRDCCVSPSNLARETGSHTRLDYISHRHSCKPIGLFGGPFLIRQRALHRNRETPSSVKIS